MFIKMYNMKTINDQFKQLRKVKGVSQTSLSKMAGVSRVTIHRFEKSNHNIQLEILIKMIRCLDGELAIVS